MALLTCAVLAAPPLGGSDLPTPEQLQDWQQSWLKPNDRSFYPTKCADTAFVPDAICPEWEDFIDLIVPDRLIRTCIQRAMGALLFGTNSA